MLSPRLVGALILAVPAIVLAWAVLWRKERRAFWFALVLVAVGVGYLMATGATEDVARLLVPQISEPPPARAR